MTPFERAWQQMPPVPMETHILMWNNHWGIDWAENVAVVDNTWYNIHVLPTGRRVAVRA